MHPTTRATLNSHTLVDAILTRQGLRLHDIMEQLARIPGRKAHDILDRAYVRLGPNDRLFLDALLELFAERRSVGAIGAGEHGPKTKTQRPASSSAPSSVYIQ